MTPLPYWYWDVLSKPPKIWIKYFFTILFNMSNAQVLECTSKSISFHHLYYKTGISFDPYFSFQSVIKIKKSLIGYVDQRLKLIFLSILHLMWKLMARNSKIESLQIMQNNSLSIIKILCESVSNIWLNSTSN